METAMQPWMSSTEIQTILKYLKSYYSMLEYGSGGSTLLFPNYVNEYYSLEHDEKWFNKVKNNCGQNVNITHVSRDYATPDINRIKATTWQELDTSSRAKDFKTYIEYPQFFKTKFNAVLIDGRARPECAKFIKDYITDDGYMFMHDYWPECRSAYRVVEEHYQVIDKVVEGQGLAVFRKKI